jgi:hypothetical protein
MHIELFGEGVFRAGPLAKFLQNPDANAGNVCCRYPEAVPFMIPPNLLLPNLPHSPEHKGYPDYGQHSYQFEHQNHRCVPFEGTISFRWKLLTNG